MNFLKKKKKQQQETTTRNNHNHDHHNNNNNNNECSSELEGSYNLLQQTISTSSQSSWWPPKNPTMSWERDSSDRILLFSDDMWNPTKILSDRKVCVDCSGVKKMGLRTKAYKA